MDTMVHGASVTTLAEPAWRKRRKRRKTSKPAKVTTATTTLANAISSTSATATTKPLNHTKGSDPIGSRRASEGPTISNGATTAHVAGTSQD